MTKYNCLNLIFLFLFKLSSVSSAKVIIFNNKRTINRKSLQIFSSQNNIDEVFGSEFKAKETYLVKDKIGYKEVSKVTIESEKRIDIMKGYDNMRISFVADSIFVAMIGLCLTWGFGTYKDAVSFAVGSLLGGAYAILLGSFVEKIGSNEKNTSGNLRFAPVILLIAIYSKNKDSISIIPELLGFFSYQVGSLLQIFNEDAYSKTDK